MMNVYEDILEFKGTWRKYQRRVLESAELYRNDGKIHIVAPPGSGKTTLGIELIRRLGEPCLILSPAIVIREQWVERVREAFLCKGGNDTEILSNQLQTPGLITSITYQSLYSAVTKGRAEEEEHSLDYADFNLLETVRNRGIKTICLDECHHLRSEWWKALEEFVRELKDVYMIALTATPPYDSTPLEWERYSRLCGPVDEEILVPELVKEGSLCPHQDYVYFNYPTREEQKTVRNFRKMVHETIKRLMSDELFVSAVSGHRGIGDYAAWADTLLENPPYLSALLIFFQEKGIPYSQKWLKLLGVTHLPRMNPNWMEILLQGFLYEDTDSYPCEEGYREELVKDLKRAKLIERKKVGLVMNQTIEKLLITSKGKLNSIQDIVISEYQALGRELRLLILTDYIRKEYIPALGNPGKAADNIGVLPIFEMLRRNLPQELRLGILCGSMVILPSEAVPYLKELAARETGGKITVTGKELTDKEGTTLGYTEVVIGGRKHTATLLVTKILEKGYMQVLVGTKSLLGEGWDSPCINSLILASFVGSYVLSNQMRGRAVRVMPGHPEKTSNIWHLVCLEGPEESQDYIALKRRMEGFLGISYTENTIENGIERLTVIKEPFTPESVERINETMRQMAKNRECLKEKWEKALVIFDKPEVADECRIPKEKLAPGLLLYNIIGAQLLWLLIEACNSVFYFYARKQGGTSLHALFFLLCSAVCLMALLRYGGKLARIFTPCRRLQSMGNGIQKALIQGGYIISDTKVAVQEQDGIFFYAWLKGGTAREKDIFASCLQEFLGTVDNQRYLLYDRRQRRRGEQWFPVPSLFAKTKEEASLFHRAVAPSIGNYKLIYTRTPEGRRILLKARCYSYANRSDRIIHRDKKIKNALE
ncbi:MULTISPECIES: DEAD/DEAH box helicase family protein [unclassified Lactonifactor]|uniref:DEAD/DEAH box helicase family protein n=1 Tax=unclassified Lactonifactor TaxID=2636670 RepID=UPI001FAA89B2|nr:MULTISPECIES: DEAD/DEAH box helicase family protein [unclassified Lactonifactor]